MKKINTLFVALASVMLATSCAEDIESAGSLSSAKISVNPSMGNLTHATETTTANLQEFKTYSFITDDSKNYMDDVTYKNNAGEWGTDAGTFYWPETGDLNFYSYAPATPGSEGMVDITSAAQKLSGFVPYATAATQQDFIYSKATGNLANNGTSGLDINFNHALSEITVAAKNSNTAYTVEVTGVKVGNVISKGDFTFPSLAGDNAAWTLGTDKATYTTEWNNANTLSADASTLDVSNTAFMLIPQQLEASNKAIEGNYLALKVKITMQGGQVVHDGWAYIAIPTLWEMGYHYNYTVDFSSGAGQDENGNPIISGTGVKFNVTVTPWDEENVDLPIKKYISGQNINTNQFSVKINNEKITIAPIINGTWKHDVSSLKLRDLRDFLNNENVVYADLSNFDTKDVTNMSNAFYGCTKLEKIKLNWDVSNVNYMTSMFYNCASLTTVDVEDWNTSNTKNMRLMFAACNSLTQLNLSKWSVYNVDSFGYMFESCSSLKTLDLSGWNVGYAELAYMFNGCSSLTTLNLSGWSIKEKNNRIGNMFNYCKSLDTIYMVGCDDATINKIRQALTRAGLSTDIVKTTRE